MENWERMAVEVFGAIPRGKVFGMQIFEDPTMPNDRIRLVHANGTYDDIPMPKG